MCVCVCVWMCVYVWVCVCVCVCVEDGDEDHEDVSRLCRRMRNKPACSSCSTQCSVHAHKRTLSRTHIFSSVGLHFLIRTHTRARGVMTHGPKCFRLLTNNTTHCKNLEKIAKTYGALRQGLRWAPMEPDGRMAGARTQLFQTFNQQHNPLQKFGKNCKNIWSAKARSPMGPDGPDGPAA